MNFACAETPTSSHFCFHKPEPNQATLTITPINDLTIYMKTTSTTHLLPTTLRSLETIVTNALAMKSLIPALLLLLLTPADAIHHMKREVTARQNGNVPLVVTNRCGETIYPGIVTQAGTGPASQGFQLTPGQNNRQTVSSNWQGRVWGRTNCSFNAQGTAQGGGAACSTGDCGGTVSCQATVSSDRFYVR